MNGTLLLKILEEPRGLRLPIDTFLRSLAEDQKEKAVCVILSGNGTDGTLGLKAIKAELGMAMAEDPSSAEYESMPRSAIETGMVDYILRPDRMGAQLVTYVKQLVSRGVGEKGSRSMGSQVMAANSSFCSLFNTSRDAMVGESLFDLGNGEWNIPKLRELLEKILPENSQIENFVVEHDFPKIGRKQITIDARRIYREDVGTEAILLAFKENIGERSET